MRAILLVVTVLMFISGEVYGANALRQLNWRRAQVGLPAYKADAKLQAAAERSARAQARRGSMFHNSHIGNRSGVGMTSQNDPQGRRFHTCYSMGRGTAWAGAAAVVGRNGRTYYSLDLRNSPSGNTFGQRCGKCGRIH